MGNINNWYADQFRTKLVEWNIVAPANYSKAELKSLYMAYLSQRSGGNQNSETQNVTISTQDTNNSSAAVPDHRIYYCFCSRQYSDCKCSATTKSGLISSEQLVNTMSSLVKQVMNKDEKDDVSRRTLDQFSVDRNPGNNSVINSTASEYFGIHPEQIRNIDFVSETVKDKILSGKYVSLATLLIPEYAEQTNEKKDRYKDARLNRSLSIEEFIVAFNKYKRIHCTRHPWRKAELDEYEANIIEISRVYGKKFYEYHKIFSQKCAMVLEHGKKVNWAKKDKDLLQMIIGGTACNACGICNALICYAILSTEYQSVWDIQTTRSIH